MSSDEIKVCENVLKEERPRVQCLFNPSETMIMGLEALKIMYRNMTIEMINHYHKLQGKQ